MWSTIRENFYLQVLITTNNYSFKHINQIYYLKYGKVSLRMDRKCKKKLNGAVFVVKSLEENSFRK